MWQLVFRFNSNVVKVSISPTFYLPISCKKNLNCKPVFLNLYAENTLVYHLSSAAFIYYDDKIKKIQSNLLVVWGNLSHMFDCTDCPRNSRTFYLQICWFTLGKVVQNNNFLAQMDFLYANSVFEVQNEGTYLPRISRETCTRFRPFISEWNSWLVTLTSRAAFLNPKYSATHFLKKKIYTTHHWGLLSFSDLSEG